MGFCHLLAALVTRNHDSSMILAGAGFAGREDFNPNRLIIAWSQVKRDGTVAALCELATRVSERDQGIGIPADTYGTVWALPVRAGAFHVDKMFAVESDI